jgi:DHA2 family multidrug resistance protein-like MFS transporter
MTALVSLPFEIQRLGYSAVQTGLLMTPWPLAIAVVAPLSGRLSDRHHAGLLGGVGLLLMAAGLTSLALFPAGAPAFSLVWRMALCGVGFALFQPPNNRALLSSAPRVRSGAAGGMLSTARLLGQSLGAALVAILFRIHPQLGSKFALGAAALIALAAALVSVTRLATDKGVSA